MSTSTDLKCNTDGGSIQSSNHLSVGDERDGVLRYFLRMFVTVYFVYIYIRTLEEHMSHLRLV
jgi:hypothetical protein